VEGKETENNYPCHMGKEVQNVTGEKTAAAGSQISLNIFRHRNQPLYSNFSPK